MSRRALMIAAPSSGAGKTTVSRCLMAVLAGRGLRVQPFKCGPDYIDTKFHEAVCGRESVNLDTFMASEQHVCELFDRYGADADISIVEGMMGLYDGYDRDLGSSAEIARVLGLPVVLVVDARSAAYSLAPLISGFLNFRSDVRIAGIIYNKVGSERHAALLRQVCSDLDVPCFGCLPKQVDLETGSRYLGLDFSELTDSDGMSAVLAQHVDVEALCALEAQPPSLEYDAPQAVVTPTAGLTALVARNAESFSFVYREQLDAFRRVTFFDPETDVPDFSGVDLLYLPGGYPEKHLQALVRNEAARKAIRQYADQGGRVQAECGGMMYLCQSIVSDDGSFPMCGVLPYTISACQRDRRLSLGYRRFLLNGREYRGHEFHYTQFLAPLPPSACQVYDAKGRPVPTPVIKHKNVLASYTHLYPLVYSPSSKDESHEPDHRR